MTNTAEELSRVVRQVQVQPVCGWELPARGSDHVSRAHAGGVAGRRGDDHAADVGARGEPGEDAGFLGEGGERVRARIAGLRA
jgi:hypothetical protein